MTIMNKDDGKEDKTISFITQSRNLLVWDCHSPCVFFIPPNCFCANLTFELASSIGSRFGSLIWLPEMVTSLKWLKIRQEEILKSSIHLDNLELDANTWFHWFKNKGNDLSEEQVEFVKEVSSVLTGLIKARKSVIDTTNGMCIISIFFL